MYIKSLSAEFIIFFGVTSFFLVILIFLYRKIKKYQQTISSQNKQLEILDEKLKANNENMLNFAESAAHDLVSPFVVNLTFHNMIYEKYNETISEKDKKLFETMNKSNKSSIEMVKGLLEYSKISNDKFILEKTNLNTIINNVLSKLKTQVDDEKGKIIVSDNFPIVNGHSIFLEQVFFNLIDNALKFSKTNTVSNINITWKPHHNNSILIMIADNGIGIEKKYHDYIFKIFKKIHPKSEYSGNGIGLSTCKKIIERCEGEIALDSELEKGTTFYITLKLESS